jgi:hypothetical protein
LPLLGASFVIVDARLCVRLFFIARRTAGEQSYPPTTVPLNLFLKLSRETEKLSDLDDPRMKPDAEFVWNYLFKGKNVVKEFGTMRQKAIRRGFQSLQFMNILQSLCIILAFDNIDSLRHNAKVFQT